MRLFAERFRRRLAAQGPPELLTSCSMFAGHVNLGTALALYLWNADNGAAAIFVAFVACVIPYAAVEVADHRKNTQKGNALPDRRQLCVS